MDVQRAHLVFYVRDQEISRRFYAAVFERPPSLDADGMTEFDLADGAVLGLMPETGIRRLLEGRVDPGHARAGPRAELYLVVNDVPSHHRRALAAGARELDPPRPRDWGHIASYLSDPDGHVLAFGEPERAGGATNASS